VLRLRSLPAARALSLLEEPLFPAFRARYWSLPVLEACIGLLRAARANARGRWLETRGLARFVRAESWRDAASQLPTHGAVFVELESPDDSPLPELALGLRLCVAAPLPPRAPHAFRIVRTPEPTSTCARWWIGWPAPAARRTLRAFARAVVAVGRAARARHHRRTRAALGLCGLADELGARALTEDSTSWCGALRRRASRPRSIRRGARDVLSQERYGRWWRWCGVCWQRMRWRGTRLGARTLAFARARGIATRSRPGLAEDDARHRRGRLAQRGSERAARKLPPGAFRVIRSFEQAGLLEAAGNDGLKLGPRFVRARCSAKP